MDEWVDCHGKTITDWLEFTLGTTWWWFEFREMFDALPDMRNNDEIPQHRSH